MRLVNDRLLVMKKELKEKLDIGDHTPIVIASGLLDECKVKHHGLVFYDLVECCRIVDNLEENGGLELLELPIGYKVNDE